MRIIIWQLLCSANTVHLLNHMTQQIQYICWVTWLSKYSTFVESRDSANTVHLLSHVTQQIQYICWITWLCCTVLLSRQIKRVIHSAILWNVILPSNILLLRVISCNMYNVYHEQIMNKPCRVVSVVTFRITQCNTFIFCSSCYVLPFEVFTFN